MKVKCIFDIKKHTDFNKQFEGPIPLVGNTYTVDGFFKKGVVAPDGYECYGDEYTFVEMPGFYYLTDCFIDETELIKQRELQTI